ncbi:hypothetical protein [Geotalea sp. SG265]|uniref:hypothetical protein n=1 Tax=Geotalea sp. SG265 TaxID=2922867 RepID=UPI001FAF2E0C|nr:hypothetical protein [Geotalea sp. SG265]
MTLPPQKPRSLVLDGDWSVAGVARQLPLIMAYLAGLRTELSSDGGVAAGRLAIVLEGVETLDACGCQLLALLACQVLNMGWEPSIVAVPANLQEIIDTFGFSHYFRSGSSGGSDR